MASRCVDRHPLHVKVGPYEILGELGRGGMGAVYRVRSRDGTDAALKLLAKSDATTLARFERERRLLGSFTARDGFVPLLDAGTQGELSYLVMPVVEGGTLRQRLERGALGIPEALALARTLAEAMGRAHERGVVHRDLKPENVLFAAGGEPLIADLGLAKHFDREAPGASQSVSLSSHGELRGTVGYMAPEQILDAASAGPAADVFALGAILYECLAGRPAFEGMQAIEVLEKVTTGEVEPLSRTRRDVPAWLAAAVGRALARDPARRLRDGTALRRALEEPEPSRRPAKLLAATVLLVAITLVLVSRTLRPAPDAPSSPPGGATRPVGLTAAELTRRARARHEGGDLDGAIADYTRAIELDPRCAEAFVNRANLRVARRDLGGAASDAERAVELSPGSAGVFAIRGDVRRESGDLDGALSDYDRAIRLDPGNSSTFFRRGSVRNARGDLEGALSDYDRAVELDPGSAPTITNRGTVRRARGDRDGAIADFTRAIELDPGHAPAFHDRGVVRLEKGDLAGAISDEGRAIELDPRYVEAFRGRGDARAAAGDLAAAIADYDRAIELDPRRAGVFYNRALVRRRAGDRAGALADYDRAIQLDPRDALAWTNRGLARQEIGDVDGALADYDRSIEIDPRSATSFKNRGVTRQVKGDLAGAAEDFARTLALDPGIADAAAMRAFVEQNGRVR